MIKDSINGTREIYHLGNINSVTVKSNDYTACIKLFRDQLSGHISYNVTFLKDGNRAFEYNSPLYFYYKSAEQVFTDAIEAFTINLRDNIEDFIEEQKEWLKKENERKKVYDLQK